MCERTSRTRKRRTCPDYNDYLSTWVEYKNFYDELSLSTTIRGTQTQLKNVNGGIVLMNVRPTSPRTVTNKQLIRAYVDVIHYTVNIHS